MRWRWWWTLGCWIRFSRTGRFPVSPPFDGIFHFLHEERSRHFLHSMSLMHSMQMFSHNSLNAVGKLILSHKNIFLSTMTVCYAVMWALVRSSLKSSLISVAKCKTIVLPSVKKLLSSFMKNFHLKGDTFI